MSADLDDDDDEQGGGVDVAEEYVSRLEERLVDRSERMEELHLEAAIDAQLTDTTAATSRSRCVSLPATTTTTTTTTPGGHPSGATTTAAAASAEGAGTTAGSWIFDDYVNPNAVSNCLSPYVPTRADRMSAFHRFFALSSDDVVLDVGCGDGRFLVAAARLTDCRGCVGIDVSPVCIDMAERLAREEGLLRNGRCRFFGVDATLPPDILLREGSALADALESATVAYLYTYPSLLMRLVPLLARLTSSSSSSPSDSDSGGSASARTSDGGEEEDEEAWRRPSPSSPDARTTTATKEEVRRRRGGGRLRAVITSTYHFPDHVAIPVDRDETHDFCRYSKIHHHDDHDVNAPG